MLESLIKNAFDAKIDALQLSTEQKNHALQCIVNQIKEDSSDILAANAKDIKLAENQHMSIGLIDRLRLNSERIDGMIEGVLKIIELSDPIGEELESIERSNGLQIHKIRVPLGLIGIIYESRPNVTIDAFALCFKAGNAVILKGGSDAIHSNIAIVQSIKTALNKLNINENIITLIENTDREITQQFMKYDDYIDVLIPRGSAGLIRFVKENSKIPVLETGSGNCHIYVDKDADLTMAAKIIINAKTQRIGVCNACESLVIHEDILEQFLPILEKELEIHNVEIRADKDALQYLQDGKLADEKDFSTEYLDYVISIKTVSSVEEAIKHINLNNTKHSESIITNNKKTANLFLQLIDASCVYVNASTRFTDGFEFGFGAEIGISTQKLHARGPMGLKELTSYQYQIWGNGQIR